MGELYRKLVVPAIILSIGLILIGVGIHLYGIEVKWIEWIDSIGVQNYERPYGSLAIILGFIGFLWCVIAVIIFIVEF